MERVVVGIDREAASDVAVDWVTERARRRPVQVTLVTAFDMLLDDLPAAAAHLERAKQRLERGAPGVAVTTALIDGSIVEALVGQTAEADLMVLGYHRTHPLLSTLTGALPARVAARSHCATVVVPEDWEPREGSIVLGVGDDDVADTAVQFAVREAQHPRRPLDVVHAWQLPSPSWDAVGALVASADDLHAAHRGILDELVARLREEHPALDIHDTLAEGPAVAALLETAEDAELVVLGTHRRGPMTGLILGSVAIDLLPRCRVPVAIVPLLAPLVPAAGVLSTVAVRPSSSR